MKGLTIQRAKYPTSSCAVFFTTKRQGSGNGLETVLATIRLNICIQQGGQALYSVGAVINRQPERDVAAAQSRIHGDGAFIEAIDVLQDLIDRRVLVRQDALTPFIDGA